MKELFFSSSLNGRDWNPTYQERPKSQVHKRFASFCPPACHSVFGGLIFTAFTPVLPHRQPTNPHPSTGCHVCNVSKGQKYLRVSIYLCFYLSFFLSSKKHLRCLGSCLVASAAQEQDKASVVVDGRWAWTGLWLEQGGARYGRCAGVDEGVDALPSSPSPVHTHAPPVSRPSPSIPRPHPRTPSVSLPQPRPHPCTFSNTPKTTLSKR